MISVLNLGRCDYATALRLQETLVELRKQNRVGNVLLFVEHTPVITLGRNARETNIVAPRELLASRGVEIYETNRGGDVTFHGPGQLVAYPIFDLRSFDPKLGVIEYVRRLEELLMRICAQFTIETQRIPGMTGVWTYPTAPPRLNPRPMGRDYIPSGEDAAAEKVPEDAAAELVLEDGPSEMSGAPGSRRVRCGDNLGISADGSIGLSSTAARTTTSYTDADGPYPPSVGECGERPSPWQERKIAAIGVHISRGVTSHGFALNVTTNLDFFQLIVPCGLTKPVTSIEFETGLRPSLDEVMTLASRTFGELFHAQILWLDSIHDLIPEASLQPPAPVSKHAPQNAPAVPPRTSAASSPTTSISPSSPSLR
jgi:lipoate-protein ligase B